jgi:hypothetical protein
MASEFDGLEVNEVLRGGVLLKKERERFCPVAAGLVVAFVLFGESGLLLAKLGSVRGCLGGGVLGVGHVGWGCWCAGSGLWGCRQGRLTLEGVGKVNWFWPQGGASVTFSPDETGESGVGFLE